MTDFEARLRELAEQLWLQLEAAVTREQEIELIIGTLRPLTLRCSLSTVCSYPDGHSGACDRPAWMDEVDI